MEAHLVKFVERVRCLSERNGDGESVISSEYARIRQQNGHMKQTYGLTTEAGGVKENVKKNRYKDILPYDQSRVILSPTMPDHNSDYINANFVKGAIKSRTYIATQGPLSNTVVDFWRMIWQYNVQVIIMACKEIEMGKKKCEVYWASSGESSVFGPFTVSTVEESFPNEEVILRTLAVKYCDETHTVSQFQYTAWPDHGIPNMPDGILGMMEQAHIRQSHNTTPMLIHCSAGCGRTGVICAIDYVSDLLDTKKIEEDFSIMDIVLELRRQRPSAVQTKEQYEFLFHTVAHMFEQAVREPSQPNQNQTKVPPSFYVNVVPPKPALRSASVSGANFDQRTRKPPPLRPRSSHPPSSTKMNDTYAVVSKTKPPPAALSVHHYDNAERSSRTSVPEALYSTVKPKVRAVGSTAGNTTAPNVPAYICSTPANQTPAAAATEYCGYEMLPAETQMKNPQFHTAVPKGPSDNSSSTDDDYEYVSNPVLPSSSVGSSGGLGFKCRIKKPKGPRDPPAEWNHPER
ncbi:tyrosine-protein phosphatase non-receptor type 18 [Brachyhypopomus gauderio]|uniref:tyrosine-protein phosphatase non-receptor type 18 n=1 Tax=Brachyhypopomus gauderio TaxID=698409 RepID=UPI0040438F44